MPLLVLFTATALGQPGRVLHRAIPGDLPLDEASASAHSAPPSQPGTVAEQARGTGWRENQSIDPALTRPRTSWSTEPREMDRQTRSPPGTRLGYQEVFTPAVAPFKRGQAYDQIDELGRLAVRDPSLRPVQPGEDAPRRWGSSPRARFVGELNVELSPAWPTPIPGVAGEQRLLSYETANGSRVEFSQDSAGNLYVRGTAAGATRLTYVLEAPDSAFVSPSVPAVSVQEAAQEVPQEVRPLAPTWLAERAGRVLSQLGLSARTPLDTTLSTLVGHFRAFRDAALPDSQGADLYTELALGNVGACRHRAYALVPTLHALGIPARYVGNEAHAWVEVFVTRVGWVRIDLGGWDVPLDARSATERPSYRPASADPFPTPPGYRSGYSQGTQLNNGSGGGGSVGPTQSAQGNASGQSGAENASEGNASEGNASEGNASGANASGVNASGAGRSGRAVSPPAQRRTQGVHGVSAAPGSPAESRSAAAATEQPESAEDPEAPVQPNLTLAAVEADESAGYVVRQGYARGSMVRVRGRALDERGGGAAGLVVELRLVRDRRSSAVLGTTVTGEDGSWEARVLLPASLEGGEYELRAVSQRAGRFLSATAQ